MKNLFLFAMVFAVQSSVLASEPSFESIKNCAKELKTHGAVVTDKYITFQDNYSTDARHLMYRSDGKVWSFNMPSGELSETRVTAKGKIPVLGITPLNTYIEIEQIYGANKLSTDLPPKEVGSFGI